MSLITEKSNPIVQISKICISYIKVVGMTLKLITDISSNNIELINKILTMVTKPVKLQSDLLQGNMRFVKCLFALPSHDRLVNNSP